MRSFAITNCWLLLTILPTTILCNDGGDGDIHDNGDKVREQLLPNRTTNVIFMEYDKYNPYYKPNGAGIIQMIIVTELSKHLHQRKYDIMERKDITPLWKVEQRKSFESQQEMLDLIKESNLTKIYEILNMTESTPDLFFIAATTFGHTQGHFKMVPVIKTTKAVLMVPTEEVLLIEKFLKGISNCFGITFFAVCVAIDLASVIWLIESRSNPDFQNTFGTGLWSSFWYCFVTMTTVGYGDKVPKNFFSRLLCLVWMLFGLMLTGIIITTVMESVQMEYEPSGKIIGVVRNTSEADIIETQLGGIPRYFKQYDKMYEAAKNEDVDAMLCEATLAASNFLNTGDLTMVSEYDLPSYVNAYYLGGDEDYSIFKIDFGQVPIDSTSANSAKAKLTPPYQVVRYHTRSMLEIFDQKDDGVVLYTSIVAGVVILIGIISEVFARFTAKGGKKKASIENERRKLRALKDYQMSTDAKKLGKIEQNLLAIIKEVKELKYNKGEGSGSGGVSNEAFTKI